MKSSFLSRAAVAVFLLAGFATASRATTLGYGTSTAGNAIWDTFSTINFSNQAPTSAVTTDFSSTLSSTMAGGLLLGGGDRIYAMGNAFDLSVAGTATTALTTFTLQLKFTSPSIGTVADAFTVSSSFGTTPSAFVLGTSVETAGTFNIVTWTWTALNVSAASPFSINITSGADHISLDGVRVDAGAVTASAVPEPSTYAAIFGSLVLVGAVARRRFVRKASVAVAA